MPVEMARVLQVRTDNGQKRRFCGFRDGRLHRRWAGCGLAWASGEGGLAAVRAGATGSDRLPYWMRSRTHRMRTCGQSDVQKRALSRGSGGGGLRQKRLTEMDAGASGGRGLSKPWLSAGRSRRTQSCVSTIRRLELLSRILADDIEDSPHRNCCTMPTSILSLPLDKNTQSRHNVGRAERAGRPVWAGGEVPRLISTRTRSS
jgi:hypothetical protein